ncbi:MAG: hypothetical protein J5645_06355 [Lachnospiraceae bacterium]|nr:hypothetical protein [Lachnospiraceae bacterium]
MPKIIAVILELTVCICALWGIIFLTTFLHELGHAIGYMISTGGRRWHIRVGSGPRLLKTKMLTVKLFIFDGCFEPAEDKVDTRAKLVATLAGGPVVSLVLVIALLFLKFGGVSVNSAVFAESAIKSFVSFALFCNVFILIQSVIPAHYFYGEIKGMETDGRKIINAITAKNKNGDPEQ